MRPEDRSREFPKHLIRVPPHIDQRPGVPLLRHGGRRVRAGHEDPGARLRVLRHDVLNKLRDVQHRLNELETGLHRGVGRRNLRRVVRVFNEPLKSEERRHRLTIKRPGGPIQHRGPHGTEIQTGPEFLKRLEVAPETFKVSEPGVPERIRLRRHPIRIAGSDRVPVFLR